MNSKSPAECFVYNTLPGETETVTAGRFELTKDRNGNALGRFVYGKSYLARGNAVAIDPIELKLSGGTWCGHDDDYIDRPGIEGELVIGPAGRFE